jgi:hypothetical protein
LDEANSIAIALYTDIPTLIDLANDIEQLGISGAREAAAVNLQRALMDSNSVIASKKLAS